MADELKVFRAADYAVFTVMLVVSSLIGIYYRFTGDRQRTAREYLLANKNMSVIPVAFSLMASFMSAVTLLGVPAENYYYGTQFVIINIAYIFGTPIAAYVFLPVFYRMQVVSVYEYLEKRFGTATRLAMSATFIVQMVLYMSVVLYAPAVALSAVTGISKWLSILSVGFVCTFYCTIGGMKAVLWTDLFQSLLMFLAMFSVVAVGSYNVGGVGNVWQAALDGGRIEFLNFDPDPTVRHTVWTLAVGGIFVYVSLYGVNQAQVQRLLTVDSLGKAQLALFLNWPIVSALSLVTSFAGLVIYANFRHCDPLISNQISGTDQVLPRFVMEYLGHIQGLPGLFVAGIFSGALSTVSSAVNSLAAVMMEDFIRPFCVSQQTYNAHAPLILKGLAFSFGLLCVLLTGVVEKLGGVLQASFMIFGVVGGPLLGVFTLGMLFPRTNQKCAIVGLVVALLVGFWVGTGAILCKVTPQKLPLLDDGCPSSSASSLATQILENATTAGVNSSGVFDTFGVTTTSSDIANWTSSVVTGVDGINATVIPESGCLLLPLYKLSYQWYCGFGWLMVILVGNLMSYFTHQKHVNPDYLSPMVTLRHKRGSQSWDLGRDRNGSVTSSQMPMTLIKE
ncbi:putative sodium-dependent multivitamin transporter [Ornithodoros turicata]|uniref:putative sodium-dependent multivitamin transporter n=1 Tax=Ornithodoros turicata TaxID=34597 RepID=UPI003139FA51